MSIKNKFRSFFALDDEEYEYVEEDQHYEEEKNESSINRRGFAQEVPQQQSHKQNVVSLQSVQKSSKVILCEPRAYSEAQEIADHLKSRRSVVVNLQRINRDQAKRIVDFLSGTVYAIGGDIQRVGVDIFLCTPENVDVSGSISDFLPEEENKRW
ncbi:cell division protein SepF [Bacillus sp. FJAT-47783]|uniref:cell division protein SepF n=1 Tax=Bacillus sp. FJAT-47783 TaxID=2922712 RepID=UPI001FAE73AA|nr:cell division protein SepF [Bacillus sp. FJAT-47783]